MELEEFHMRKRWARHAGTSGAAGLAHCGRAGGGGVIDVVNVLEEWKITLAK
jgi:hypothetical protein